MKDYKLSSSVCLKLLVLIYEIFGELHKKRCTSNIVWWNRVRFVMCCDPVTAVNVNSSSAVMNITELILLMKFFSLFLRYE